MADAVVSRTAEDLVQIITNNRSPDHKERIAMRHDHLIEINGIQLSCNRLKGTWQASRSKVNIVFVHGNPA